jgi:hypothetical protein
MDSLDVNSCYQVPRYTCFNTRINNVHIVIDIAPNGYHWLRIYFDSRCAHYSGFSEIQRDFACFDYAGVCVPVGFF